MVSGALALAGVLSLPACDGDEPAAAALPGPASASPAATVAAPQVVVDADLFKRRRAKLEAVSLDCLGGRVASVTADRVPDPNAMPLENPDPATDGLAALAATGVPEHTHAMNRGWDDTDPPTPIYLFPKPPAQSGNAVVRFETRPGVAVASLVVGRDVPRGPRHVESSNWCSW
jgi:hypothetical protein